MSPAEDLPDEVRTRAYHAQPVWKRMVVIAAGPAVNLIVAFLLLVVYFGLIGAETPSRDGTVGVVEKGYPAASVLEPGDRVVAVDGKRGDPADLSRQISSHECPQGSTTEGCKAATPATLTIERDGRRLTERVRPIYDDNPGVNRTRLGFGYVPGPRETLGLGDSVTQSVDSFWFITKETVSLPARLFDTEKREEISGIVGAYEGTRQTIIKNLANTVAILAIISLSLAIINLFPFLPLDGGHIFWAIVEKLRGGKPVPFSVMERAGVVGFMLVLGLFAIGLTNDIGRLSDGGFQVR